MEISTRSFRDPAGRLHFIGSHVIRQVYAECAHAYRGLLETPFLVAQMGAGDVVRTRVLDGSPDALSQIVGQNCAKLPLCANGDLLLVHDAIPFPSFPAEWSPEMLRAAACLTLDIAEQALEHGICLKDATPCNVLFKGPRPVFVDILSFELRHPRDPIWLAHGQFMRTFLLPILAAVSLRYPLSALFLTHRDGIEPIELYRMITPLKRFQSPFLGAVSLPVWLSRKAEAKGASTYLQKRLKSDAQTSFILHDLFRRLRRTINRQLRSDKSGATPWLDYGRTCTYDQHSFAGKSQFVERFLREARPSRVLDVGCNTGHFSTLAASSGAEVVAIDREAAVIDTLWKNAREKSLDILPLVVDFARPTPALGWHNAETPSFLARSKGRFDAIFMLALIHHLTISDQIPLHMVMALAAEVTKRYLVIEYVAPGDPQFIRLTRGRDELYRHMTRDFFESTATNFFRILEKREIGNHGRWLYVMEKNLV